MIVSIFMNSSSISESYVFTSPAILGQLSELAELGTQWTLSTETLVLRVPFAVVKGDLNILINPLHPDMMHVTLSDVAVYQFDERPLR